MLLNAFNHQTETNYDQTVLSKTITTAGYIDYVFTMGQTKYTYFTFDHVS